VNVSTIDSQNSLLAVKQKSFTTLTPTSNSHYRAHFIVLFCPSRQQVSFRICRARTFTAPFTHVFARYRPKYIS